MQATATSNCISLRNILLPTNFSPGSATALTYGAGLARRYGTTLYAVTVVPEEITDYVQPPDPFYLRHCAERKMETLSQLELLRGIEHRELVEEGFVSESVRDLIDRFRIDLVVLGTHGRGGIKKLVRGSLAEEIVNAASCPVLTVGPKVSDAVVSQPRLHSILYGTNLLYGPGRSLPYALWLAEREGARMTLLHVLKPRNEVPADHPQIDEKTANERLRQLLPLESNPSVEREYRVEAGVPGEQIVRVAESVAADLIVMGSQHRSYGWASTHLPWVTLHQVLCHARCPILAVPD